MNTIESSNLYKGITPFEGKTEKPIPKNIFEAAEFGTVEDVKKYLKEIKKNIEKDEEDGNPITIKSFIDSIGLGNNLEDFRRGESLLHYAVFGENIEMIKFLVAQGININIGGINRETPLHHAARAAYKEGVKFLIKEGAEVNAKNRNGRTPLYAIIEIIVEDCWGYCSKEHKEIIKLLFAKGATMEVSNEGKDLLDLVVPKNTLELIKLLEKERIKRERIIQMTREEDAIKRKET